MVVMEDGHIRQAGAPRQVFERPKSPFVARFIGGHNVLSGEHGPIAVRADRCRLAKAAKGEPHLSGRVAAVEYQGSIVRVVLETDHEEGATALVPDNTFYASPVRPGDPATLVWSAEDAHHLTDA